MGLQDIIDETKKELEGLNAEEKVVEVAEIESVEPTEEPEEDIEAEAEEDIAEEENLEEESEDKVEAKEEESEEEKNSRFAKMRRDLAAEKKLNADLRAEKENPIPEPQSAEDGMNREVEDIIMERRYQKATQEFEALEANFSKDVEDFDAISLAYKTAIYQSKRVLNRNKTHNELLEDTRNEILHTAANYMKQGLDPIQEMYDDAKSLGLTPVQTNHVEEKEIKPDLSKVAKNKARNSGMVAGKGSGGKADISREHAATEMTVGQWSKLSAGEKKRLLMDG